MFVLVKQYLCNMVIYKIYIIFVTKTYKLQHLNISIFTILHSGFQKQQISEQWVLHKHNPSLYGFSCWCLSQESWVSVCVSPFRLMSIWAVSASSSGLADALPYSGLEIPPSAGSGPTAWGVGSGSNLQTPTCTDTEHVVNMNVYRYRTCDEHERVQIQNMC